MNILSVPKPQSAGASHARRARAFTLPELAVATGVFSLMLLGVIFTWLFCLKWDELVVSKLGATEMARMSFDQMARDIRSAKWWKIGNGTNFSFAACGNATNQIGNAIQLSSNSNTNAADWTAIYYFDTNKCQLCYATNGMTQVIILANYLTNSSGTGMTFSAQQYNGAQAQDWTYKYLITATMEFCQYQYPLTHVGPGNYYDYYRLQIKAASHSPN